MFPTLILERFLYSVIHLSAILNSLFFCVQYKYILNIFLLNCFKFHMCEHLANSNSQHFIFQLFLFSFTSVTLFKLTLRTIFTTSVLILGHFFFILQLHFCWVIIYSSKICLVVEIVVYLYQCQVKPRISKTDHQGRYNFPTWKIGAILSSYSFPPSWLCTRLS